MKKSQLERMLKVEGEMRTHYEELFNTSVRELTAKNMMLEHLLNTLHEIKALDEDNIATAIVENAINRHHLDVIIHTRNIARGQDNLYSNKDDEGTKS